MKANEAPEKVYIEPNLDFIWGMAERSCESEVEYTQTDAIFKKAKEAFCKATCNGHPPRSTCTSLGTCKEHDNFVKLLKRE